MVHVSCGRENFKFCDWKTHLLRSVNWKVQLTETNTLFFSFSRSIFFFRFYYFYFSSFFALRCVAIEKVLRWTQLVLLEFPFIFFWFPFVFFFRILLFIVRYGALANCCLVLQLDNHHHCFLWKYHFLFNEIEWFPNSHSVWHLLSDVKSDIQFELEIEYDF